MHQNEPTLETLEINAKLDLDLELDLDHALLVDMTMAADRSRAKQATSQHACSLRRC